MASSEKRLAAAPSNKQEEEVRGVSDLLAEWFYN
jgi:hypothetical protein